MATATKGKSPGPFVSKPPSNVLNTTLIRPGTSKQSIPPGTSNLTSIETKTHDGYTYEKRATTNDSILWQCVAVGCKAKYRIMRDNGSVTHWEVKLHNHNADVERITDCNHDVKFEKGKIENSEILLIDGHKFYAFAKKGQLTTRNWKCRLSQRLGCKSKVVTYNNEYITFIDLDHNHGVNTGTYQRPKSYLPIAKEERD